MSRRAMSEPAATPRKATPLLRLWPLAALALIVALVFALDLDRYVSFETLRAHREQLLAFVQHHPLAAPLLFVCLYAALIALSIPGGAIMTIAGGFLFGTLLGTALVLVGATTGATVVFLIARSALGDVLRARAGPRIRRMEEGFRRDAFSYLLVLRLIPIFPFWLVNIVPAVLGVSLGVYVLGTFIGIIPGSLVYASVGNGLGAVFEAGGTPDLGIIFSHEILLPIVGLAVLALLPVAYRHLRSRQSK
jgi:uncharacterized membrane protein YdjX (TVP38/TMEM64 family)